MIQAFLIVFLAIQGQSLIDVYKAAAADMEASRWTEAIGKYQQILKEDPTHLSTMFNLAVCYTKLDNAKQAVDVYRQLLEQDGSVYEARVNIALLLLRSGERTAALEQMERAVTLRPDDPNTHMVAASFYEEADLYDAYRQHLIRAEERGLRTVDLYVALSQVEARLQNEAAHREYLEKAAALDPSNRDIQHDLGIAYRRAGQFEKAIAVLKPLVPDARLELALSYFGNKNFADAARSFEELSQLEPNEPRYFSMLALANMEVKRYPQAIASARRVLELKPDDVEAYGILGSALYVQEDWAGAAAALQRFVQFKPQHAFSHFVIAHSFDRLENFKEALVHYNRFLALDDGSSDARSFQARQRAKVLEQRVRR